MIYLLAEQLTFCLFLPRPPIVRTAVRGKEIAAHKHRVHTASVRRERKRAGGEGCCTVLTWNRCCSLAIVTARCIVVRCDSLLLPQARG